MYRTLKPGNVVRIPDAVRDPMSFNGRTPDRYSGHRGSNPCVGASNKPRARSSNLEEQLSCTQPCVGSHPTGSTYGMRIVSSAEERRLVTPEATGSRPVRSAHASDLR